MNGGGDVTTHPLLRTSFFVVVRWLDGKRMKTLIAITTCARYSERRAAIRETWLPLVKDADVCFVSGVPIPDVVCLNVPDSYAELPQKTYATVCYAVDHGYDVLVKVDDDTFLLPYVAEFAKQDCLCHVRPSKNDNPCYPQGGCYSLSHRSMRAVLAHPELFTVGPEDLAVGQALAAEGISLAHTERIKTTVVFGHPAPWNNILAAHCCQPREMRRIFCVFNGIGRAGQMSKEGR